MTEIEKKALALLNECGWGGAHMKRTWNPRYEALCRAIEQHERFRQDVSVELSAYSEWCRDVGAQFPLLLERFIIAKPDPVRSGLAVAVEEALELVIGDEDVAQLREALGRRGLQVTEIER